MSLLNGVLDWLSAWDATINALGSILISGGLLILYKRQHELLEDQYTHESQPDLSIDSLQYGDTSDDPVVTSELFLTLSNIGRGQATNLRVRIEPELVGSSPDLDLGSISTELQRVEKEATADNYTIVKKGNHIQSEERKEMFSYPNYAGGHFVGSDVLTTVSGNLTFQTLARSIAEIELGDRINLKNFPDKETQETTLYHLSMPSDENVAAVSHEELNVEDLPVEIEERTSKNLKDEQVEEIVNHTVGTSYLHLRHVLVYDTNDENNNEKELMDKVFPVRYGVPEEVIMKSSLDYDSFTLQGDKEGMIDRRMFKNLAESKKPEELP